MSVPARLLVFSALLTFALTGCGSSPGASAPATPPTSLDGNWSLAGARTPATYPLLATTLNVQGSQITGQGTVEVECTPAAAAGLPLFPERIGGILPLSGQIAADGTFSMTSPTIGLAPNTYTVSLTGNSPTAASPNAWTGTYTINASLMALSGSTACTYSHPSSFSAVPIPPFTGTYSGPATNGLFGPGIGASAALTMQVIQGPATLVTHGTSNSYQLPLSATVAVTGSSCFTSGTTAGAIFPSEITGDTFEFHFLMNDGSPMIVSGSFSDLTESVLNITSLVSGGTCTQTFGLTTLTRH